MACKRRMQQFRGRWDVFVGAANHWVMHHIDLYARISSMDYSYQKRGATDATSITTTRTVALVLAQRVLGKPEA